MPAAPTKVPPLAPHTECRLCRCMAVAVMAPHSTPPPTHPHTQQDLAAYPLQFRGMCSIACGLDLGSCSIVHCSKCCPAVWLGDCGAKLGSTPPRFTSPPPPRVSRHRQHAMPTQLSRGLNKLKGAPPTPQHNCGTRAPSPTSCPGKPGARTLGLATAPHARLALYARASRLCHARQPITAFTA